jgi:hypothetical protein
MSVNLIRVINQRCPKCPHYHRRATNKEYTNNKLFKYKNTGCFACNSRITLKHVLPTFTWICQNPNVDNRFINIVNITLSLDQKLTFFMITQTKKFNLYLPFEIMLLIFKNAFWKEENKEIVKITPKLIDHTTECEQCAKKLIMFNTNFTCHHHNIPRSSENVYGS